MIIADAVKSLVDRKSLTQQETQLVMGAVMRGDVSPTHLAAFLVALRLKGESVDEISGAAMAMRDAAVSVRFSGKILVDTCGTGGDGQGSLNISTAAAFVVAGAGFTVAKHGNRSISSRCGSADVLERLGIPVETSPLMVEKALKDVGIAFLFAPTYHPAMKNAMPVRKELGIRTIFNVLGPLTNPVRPNVQVVGVFDASWIERMAQVLVQLGCREGAVVHGEGYDEIVLNGTTEVAEIRAGAIRRIQWTAKDFGVTPEKGAMAKGGTVDVNAEGLLNTLKGQKGPFRQMVCMNAAASIAAATRQSGKPMRLPDAYHAAEQSIDSKMALEKLEGLKDLLVTFKHG